MSMKHVFVSAWALATAQLASAGLAAPLGLPAALPLIEGGLFTVAVVALVAGVRIVRSKTKR